MSAYRTITSDDTTPDSLTRQWFAADVIEPTHKPDGSENPNAGKPKANKGATFGTYAVVIDKLGKNPSMVIPLINQVAADRAAELAADENYLVTNVRDSRLVEVRITGSGKPKLTAAQTKAMAALLAGNATDADRELLAGLV